MTQRPDAVFLDRDGTIMEDAHFIGSPDQVRLLPGAARAVRAINDAGVPVIVITNQSGIARGIFTENDYHRVRERFESLLAEESGARIDASYFCPHHPSITGPCDCRKPGTRLFEKALRDFGVRAASTVYVGDRWRDVAAARKLGGRGIMIESPMTTEDDRRRARDDAIETAPTLADAVGMVFTLTDRTPAK